MDDVLKDGLLSMLNDELLSIRKKKSVTYEKMVKGLEKIIELQKNITEQDESKIQTLEKLVKSQDEYIEMLKLKIV